MLTPRRAHATCRFFIQGQTITDPRRCAAIVDRVTFNAHIVETGTDSYRPAATKARRAAG